MERHYTSSSCARRTALNPVSVSGILFSMKQNKYDDPDFFEHYSTVRRSIGGLEEAGEWPAFCALLPDLADKRVLDLGCGFGWHCRYAADQGARSVVGIDLSEKMLVRARELTTDARISYRQTAMEEVDAAIDEFDVVISSLAFHYVERFDSVCRQVHEWLVGGGWFVFSVEHPIFTSTEAQDWCYDSRNRRRHWPVDAGSHHFLLVAQEGR